MSIKYFLLFVVDWSPFILMMIGYFFIQWGFRIISKQEVERYKKLKAGWPRWATILYWLLLPVVIILLASTEEMRDKIPYSLALLTWFMLGAYAYLRCLSQSELPAQHIKMIRTGTIFVGAGIAMGPVLQITEWWLTA